MADFYKRELKLSKTLGERLKKTREEAGVSLEAAAEATHVNKGYLKAIEESNYLLLPGLVYVKNFLKTYAIFLQVSPQVVIDLYEKEEKIIKPIKKKQELKKLKKSDLPRSIITPKLLRNVAILLVIVAFLVYVGLEVEKIVSPPYLTIISPANNLVTSERTVEISGRTEPESRVTINNQEIFTNANGEFKSDIDLKDGLNSIKITSQKKRSKPSVVYLNILVESETKK